MTSVGLLCRQYLGAKRDNPMLVGGMDYLMKNLPDESNKNVYYWYYATQVMRNMNNYEWDQWNRKMRDIAGTHAGPRSITAPKAVGTRRATPGASTAAA